MPGLFLLAVFFHLTIAVGLGTLLGYVMKGRGFESYLLCLFLGLLAWPAIFCLEDRRKRCDHCRSLVPWDASACSKCSRDLHPQLRPGLLFPTWIVGSDASWVRVFVVTLSGYLLVMTVVWFFIAATTDLQRFS